MKSYILDLHVIHVHLMLVYLRAIKKHMSKDT